MFDNFSEVCEDFACSVENNANTSAVNSSACSTFKLLKLLKMTDLNYTFCNFLSAKIQYRKALFRYLEVLLNPDNQCFK